MKLLVLALGCIYSLGSIAATISNLNYFVDEKKFAFGTEFGWGSENTEAGATDTDDDGINFNLRGDYGITKNHTLGFDVGYVSTEVDTSNVKTTGLTDIELNWGWRFHQEGNNAWDLDVGLSPKLGAAETDSSGDKNGFRGDTMISPEVSYNMVTGTNFDWVFSAGIDYHAKKENENTGTNVITEFEPRTDFDLTARTRYHATEKVFVGGWVQLYQLGEMKNDTTGASFNDFDLGTELAADVGYKINNISNVTGVLSYNTLGGKQNSTTDFDITTTALNVQYNREF